VTTDRWTLERFGTELVEVPDRATLDAVLDRWDAEAAGDPVLVSLAAPGGSRALAVALGGDESMLDWVDEEDQTGPYLDSLGPRDDDGSQVAFKFSNTFSYFSPSVLIPKEQARTGLIEFYGTGARPEMIRWQLVPQGYEYKDGRYLNRDGTEVDLSEPSRSEPDTAGIEKLAAYDRQPRHGDWEPLDGFWTVYWVRDVQQDIIDHAVVSDTAGLDAVLDRVDALGQHTSHEKMAEVVSPKGDVLGVGLGRDESVLHWIAAGAELGDDLTSVGSDDPFETFPDFEVPNGYWVAQFPNFTLVPKTDARAAVEQFFETGALPDGIRWRAL